MDKRYQVFVSSTYTDLIEERHSIMLTLMKMDCIPAGMEHFPAADEEQWNFIKRIIDYSDYYLLIIGGRYGSLDEDGISFTEKEYDYAVSKNIKVVALIHGSPEILKFQNSEQDPALRNKLQAFIDKVKTKRLVEFWTDSNELPGKVALGIMHARTMHPAIGWVRANRISNEENLSELIKARDEVDLLNRELEKLRANNSISDFGDDVADFSDGFSLHYSLASNNFKTPANSVVTISIARIFNSIAVSMGDGCSYDDVSKSLNRLILKEAGIIGYNVITDDDDIKTIKFHFVAVGLIDIDREWWTLTESGLRKLKELRVIRKISN
ncbi:DUF4062 domain-containing protein [Pectobacterium brasiliense]|uniref:DUF4062 domain-containing protein n=1 Tax=Pectobacterium brasiliense TaxID=180957 RepID=UPI0019697D78|nr:DUF4062 domain-containing protein [Pectobacterium brasiliense]MBN3199511.1 DUF4062 domain-containing protein [Pectobacterium brasiliense]